MGPRENEPQVIAPQGELDAASVDEQLRRPGMAAIAAGYRDVVIDLHDVRFIDTTSMAVLLDLDRAISEQGGRIAVVHLRPNLWHYFEVTGLAATFELHEPGRQ